MPAEERRDRTQEVAGSSPASSMKKLLEIRCFPARGLPSVSLPVLDAEQQRGSLREDRRTAVRAAFCCAWA
jgi:hypothetical protein